MDLLSGSATDFQSTITTSPTPVFGDNVQDLLGTGTLHVNPSAIITVNSTNDGVDDFNSGVTTLRDAINQASADAGSDLIVFDRSLFSSQQTITLNLGELDITHNLDIIAPRDSLTGGDLVTVSGNNASRVFEIEFGSKVSIDGLVIADGNVTDDNGGGIKNSGILTLDSSIVRDHAVNINSVNTNSPPNYGASPNINLAETNGGGGIYNTGILNVNNSTLSGNKAIDNSYGSNNGTNVFGGSIYNTGTTEVSNSTLTGNTVRNGRFGTYFGGGIYNSLGGMMTLSNSTLNNNSVSSYSSTSAGGGIYNNGTMNVSNSTLNQNSTSSKGFAGGSGIYNTGTLEVSNSTLDNNSGFSNTDASGGGICNSGTVVVSNSTLSGNSATFGGGISNTGTMTVNNSTLSGNKANNTNAITTYSSGGGIYNLGTFAVSNSTISGNSASYGGGICNYRGTMTVSNSTLSSNSARYGGGICNFGTVTVSNSTLRGNSAAGVVLIANPSGGGGIYNGYSGILTLVFSTLTVNSATAGGGLYQDNVPPPFDLSPRPFGSNSIRNTIIAGNLSNIGINPDDVSGIFTSNGYNLIGDSTGSTGFDATGDIVGTSDNPIDPRLAPLDFNGGPTQTIALLPDSPAIDAGDPTVLDTDPITDQRRFPRFSNGRADIGAFEAQV